MEALIVGEQDAAEELAGRLEGEGIAARISAGARRGGIAALADSVLELERELSSRPPSPVVLADRGDRALAAALVATKLLAPVLAVPGSGAANDRLLDLLAEPAEIDALPTLLRR